MRLLPLFALLACAPDDEGADMPMDASDCGVRCGDDQLYLVDALAFATPDDAGQLLGFDLDGNEEDCDVPDRIGPDGALGVDNQFGAVFDVLPSGLTTVLPDGIVESMQTGQLMVVLEVIGQPDVPTGDGPAGLAVWRGSGDVAIGGHGRAVSHQTVTFADDEEALLGFTREGFVEAGELEAGPLPFELRMSFLGTAVELPVVRGRIRMTDDGAGGVDLVVGGVIPLDGLFPLIDLLGGEDAPLREALRGLLPLLVDVRTGPDADCDGLSIGLSGHAVPVFLYDDPAFAVDP